MVKMPVCYCLEHLFQIVSIYANPISNRICFLFANRLVDNKEIADFATDTRGVEKRACKFSNGIEIH